ncbi:MAG: CYTH domain-containing protein [Parcubacteria group bacterium]|nr:CYTH domain-containing protein [Parcubacteria group bacterium]
MEDSLPIQGNKGVEDKNKIVQREQPKEIERKFLVHALPADLETHPHTEVVQGYVAITEDGTEVRLRKKGDKYYQTIKSGSGKVRTESEAEITEEQFNVFWAATAGKRLEKTRYEIPCGDVVIELDIYKGGLSGLITAEVEFKSEEEGDAFVAPAWLGREATEDKRYKNQSLALHGIPKEDPSV